MKVEQYEGDYHTVKTEIMKRIQRENAENARLLREAQAKKDQANKFANKVRHEMKRLNFHVEETILMTC